jgi:Acetoacetate decarboxylase (ADC)
VTLVPQELPDYVELGGRQVWRPPYTARRAEVFGFALKADRGALDALLDDAFFEPSGGAVDYRCAHDHIMVTFATIAELASGRPPDSDCGYMPEKEVSVWCLAADAAAGDRLVWYLPYVFTDTGQTVATGREVYGYPKQLGKFAGDYPGKLLRGGETTVEALAINPLRQDACAEWRPMISAACVAAPGAAEELDREAADGVDMVEEFAQAFPGEPRTESLRAVGPAPSPAAIIAPADAPPPPRTVPSRPWVGLLLDTFLGRGLTGDPAELIFRMIDDPSLFFLKQFRDVECPTKACYQAVVEAPLAVSPEGASYERLDPGRFTIRFEDWASHPIARDLGVEPRADLAPERAFRATLNFDIQLGYEVWRAPT